MVKIVNAILVLFLFLNYSETYRPLGVILGMNSSSSLSTASLIVFITYCMYHSKTILSLYQRKIFRLWTNLVLIVPIIIIIINFIVMNISLGDAIYWISFNSLFAMAFLSATILAYKSSVYMTLKLTYISIITTIIGFIINYTNYQFTQKIHVFSGNDIYSSKEHLFRALSFFSHSNVAAFSILILFIILYSISSIRNHKLFFYLFSLIVLIVLIFITGSRTSLLLVLYLGYRLLPTLNKSLVDNYNINKFDSIIIMTVILILALLILSISIPYILPLFENLVSVETINRMKLFSALFENSSNNIEDASLEARITILEKYFNYIIESPLIGYGPEFAREKLRTGVFPNVSQNAWVEFAINYGIIYSAYYLYALVYTYKYATRNKYLNKYRLNSLSTLVVLIFLLGFSVNNIFWYRTLVIGLGLCFGASLKKSNYLKKHMNNLVNIN